MVTETMQVKMVEVNVVRLADCGHCKEAYQSAH